jgi:hypothetical protein
MVVFTVIFGRLANLPSESGVDGRNGRSPTARRMAQADPLLPFKIGPANGR